MKKGAYLKLHNEEDLKPVERNYATVIGRNTVSNKFIEKHKLPKKIEELLAKNYIKFQGQAHSTAIKVGIDQKSDEGTVSDLIKYMTSSSMLGLTFVGIQAPLLNDIVKVDFSRLERLQLIKCGISNIQPLNWITSKNFKTIYLRDNQITSLQPLQKTRWSHFTSIELDGNPIKQFSPLCRTHVLTYKEDVREEFFVYLMQQQIQIADISFLVKMQKKQTRFIGQQIPSKGHIRQNTVLGAIKKQQTILQPAPQQQ